MTQTIKKDVKIGKYMIKNVPHNKTTYQLFNGIGELVQEENEYSREARVEMNLSEIILFMEMAEWTTYDYEKWLHLW